MSRTLRNWSTAPSGAQDEISRTQVSINKGVGDTCASIHGGVGDTSRGAQD